MTNRARAGAPFLVLGHAFIAMGADGRRAFAVIGLTFLVIAMLRMARR